MSVNLTVKRLAQELTIGAMAKKLGITPQAVRNLETGESGVTPSRMRKTAKAYGITVEELAQHIYDAKERRRAARKSAVAAA